MSSSVSQSLNLVLSTSKSRVRHIITGIGWLLYIIGGLVVISLVGGIGFIVFVLRLRWVEEYPKIGQKPKLRFLGGRGRR